MTSELQPVPISFKAPLAVRLRRTLFTGVVILIPVALSGYVLLRLFRFMDGIFAPRIQAWIDPHVPGFYIPGLGLLLTLMLVFALGWLSSNIVGRRLVLAIERLIARIPIGGSIYNATKGVMEAFGGDQSEAFKRVVLIEYPRKDVFSIAFVTGSGRWPHIHEGTSDFVMVFLPTTPIPTSGYLLLVPRDQTTDLPLTVEEGVQLVISGGIVMPTLSDPAAPTEASGRT